MAIPDVVKCRRALKLSFIAYQLAENNCPWFHVSWCNPVNGNGPFLEIMVPGGGEFKKIALDALAAPSWNSEAATSVFPTTPLGPLRQEVRENATPPQVPEQLIDTRAYWEFVF